MQTPALLKRQKRTQAQHLSDELTQSDITILLKVILPEVKRNQRWRWMFRASDEDKHIRVQAQKKRTLQLEMIQRKLKKLRSVVCRKDATKNT